MLSFTILYYSWLLLMLLFTIPQSVLQLVVAKAPSRDFGDEV